MPTNEQIKQWAAEAVLIATGLPSLSDDERREYVDSLNGENLSFARALVELAQEAEREECAMKCRAVAQIQATLGEQFAALTCEARIRARGDKE